MEKMTHFLGCLQFLRYVQFVNTANQSVRYTWVDCKNGAASSVHLRFAELRDRTCQQLIKPFDINCFSNVGMGRRVGHMIAIDHCAPHR